MNILVLLLGGNPLPNYVAADYLLKEGRDDEDVMPIPGKIVFIYSGKTDVFFDTITKNEKLNLKPHQFCGINLGEQHREPFVIRKRLLQELRDLNHNKADPIESIHLNYTGGTKPMAVNAFVGINEFLKHRETRVIFSDLDPDHFKIVPTHLDIKEGEAPKYPLSRSGDLRDHVKLDIKGLLNLHDMGVKNEGTTRLIFDENRVDIYKFVQEAVKVYEYFKKDKKKFEKKKIIFSEFSDRFKLRGRERDNREKNLKIKQGIFEESFREIKQEFPSISPLFDTNDKLIPPAVPFVEFFSGKWLEDFVLKVLTDLKDKENIDVDVIRKGVEAAFEGRMTEIDIMVLRGYQLFLVSCTTSREIKYVKQKAFEALYRAEQLGGEHAKVIVVSPMYNRKVQEDSFSDENNLERLENDLEQFEAKRNRSLMGIDQLALPESDPRHLKARLRNIILGGE